MVEAFNSSCKSHFLFFLDWRYLVLGVTASKMGGNVGYHEMEPLQEHVADAMTLKCGTAITMCTGQMPS